MAKDKGESSKNPDAYVPNVHVLSVNVSNFVSVKLSGRSNYKIWKAQMCCLLKSQNLYDIVVNTPTSEQYDALVKGWIFGSVDEKLLEGFVDLGTAKDVWMKLQALAEFSNEDADQQTAEETSEKLSNFVTEKLVGLRNYEIWKKQMCSFLKDQKLLHIIDADHPFPPEKGASNIPRYDQRVQSWIRKYMNKKLYEAHFKDLTSARGVWGRLEYSFSLTRTQKKGTA